MKIQVGIVGVRGYAGQELFKLLSRHPHVLISYLGSTQIKSPVSFEGMRIQPFDPKKAAASCEILFLALPHGEAMRLVPPLLNNPDLRIIDFSGDFRIKAASVFKKAYGFTHTAAPWAGKAVYGLPELNREAIPGCRLVANPGCYPTATLLALAPLAKKKLLVPGGVIVDAKSGVTGAGRSAKENMMFCEMNEDFRAYKVDKHQHVPEMEQELEKLAGRKISMTFVPHLAPMNRGIYATIYVTLAKKISEAGLRHLYEHQYKEEPFVKVLPEGTWPELKSVNGTNRCEIGLHLDPSGKKAVILAAIDNLGKGAAGQAVQNMNLLLTLPETTAL